MNDHQRYSSPAVIQRARELRQELTPAEKLLWERLRDRWLAGLKFHRQSPFGQLLVNFYNATHRLVVEVNDSVRRSQIEADRQRTQVLEEQGYRLLRLPNDQVENGLESVLQTILTACAED